ncbi:hypothetical protein PUNSTDRAFT_139108 [Punctularia strigosozonata HHB-11173 SS5]|uniref:Uncharacterized protein n=1 Tax=Punctularia strigosozonata (strain HHB-11173) TaxID=741275 RepID=R7S1Z8_PUNST|nr:uncharacterized protein PUNSTDRAFT_139108 [Punctularia strigosozonata HHB-11173 SS5]EIN03802.1 hypothetical protein PUNSTDRAFT_139108 [Punctularia strigosozonata HHB-11173 SS5]
MDSSQAPVTTLTTAQEYGPAQFDGVPLGHVIVPGGWVVPVSTTPTYAHMPWSGIWKLDEPGLTPEVWEGRIVYMQDEEKGCSVYGQITHLVAVSRKFAVYAVGEKTCQYDNPMKMWYSVPVVTRLVVPLYNTPVWFGQKWWMRWKGLWWGHIDYMSA